MPCEILTFVMVVQFMLNNFCEFMTWLPLGHSWPKDQTHSKVDPVSSQKVMFCLPLCALSKILPCGSLWKASSKQAFCPCFCHVQKQEQSVAEPWNQESRSSNHPHWRLVRLCILILAFCWQLKSFVAFRHQCHCQSKDDRSSQGPERMTSRQARRLYPLGFGGPLSW